MSSPDFWTAMIDVLKEGLLNPKGITLLISIIFVSMFLLWFDAKRSAKK